MKKVLFTALAVVLFSGVSMASTKEIKVEKKEVKVELKKKKVKPMSECEKKGMRHANQVGSQYQSLNIKYDHWDWYCWFAAERNHCEEMNNCPK